MMKRPSILFYSQDIPFFSEENLSELVCANDNINGIHTEPSSHSDTDSEYGSDDEDSSNLNNLVNIQNDRRQMSNNSNEENTEELILLFKKQLLKHSEEHFSEAEVTEVTFESAKVYCEQLGKIENFKFHLQSCNIGSGSTAITWKREDTRVSKHVFTATFSFSKATQHIVRKFIVNNWVKLKILSSICSHAILAQDPLPLHGNVKTPESVSMSLQQHFLSVRPHSILSWRTEKVSKAWTRANIKLLYLFVPSLAYSSTKQQKLSQVICPLVQSILSRIQQR